MIKKLISSLLIAASVIAVFPVGASAQWKKNNTGWWYESGNSYYTGWQKIDGSWYYFDKDGYMKKGWIMDKAWWYYLKDNGTMATGKLSIKSNVYEFDSNGKWINNSLPKRTVPASNPASTNVDTNTNVSEPPTAKKMKEVSDFSWFIENGNTYFKIEDNYFIKGGWNIDGDIYIFDENGVLQKGEYISASGKKYNLGSDGKVLNCASDENYSLCPEYALTTRSTTDKYEVKLDDGAMMDISDVISEDPEKDGTLVKGESGYELDKTNSKAKVEGKTLYCKTNQIIELGDIKVNDIDSDSITFPHLLIIAQSSDEDVAFSGLSLNLEDGFFKKIHPTVVAYKAGRATITIEVNGTKTSFDVVVTE